MKSTNKLRWKQLSLVLILLLASFQPLLATTAAAPKEGKIDVRELILDHISDAYEWHITTWGVTHVSLPLPIIVRDQAGSWHFFMSSNFHHGTASFNGFRIAQEGDYRGKIVEQTSNGTEVRPLDLSITKNAFALLFSSTLLIILIMSVARWYKNKDHVAPNGFIGAMEMFIMSIQDDLVKPCIGKDYKRYSPYLLTVFFFVFINNILGLIPLFPGGANVTGNIAVTLVLAICTFLAVNLFASKEYWKEIFWPDVPWWLKFPIPLMPVIEIVSVLTKPFALMIRLFANMLAGHSVILGLTCLIFVTVSMGTAINTSMTITSVLLCIFMNCLELLVAYIQAYVFTLLSAVFIGLSRVEPHHAKEH